VKAQLRTPVRARAVSSAAAAPEAAIISPFVDALCTGGLSLLVLVLRRFRFDNLPGGILNIRGKAIGALRDQLTVDLRRQQTSAAPAR
jgi:hypothetical protein